jgi:hypothetical protein
LTWIEGEIIGGGMFESSVGLQVLTRVNSLVTKVQQLDKDVQQQ